MSLVKSWKLSSKGLHLVLSGSENTNESFENECRCLLVATVPFTLLIR